MNNHHHHHHHHRQNLNENLTKTVHLKSYIWANRRDENRGDSRLRTKFLAQGVSGCYKEHFVTLQT